MKQFRREKLTKHPRGVLRWRMVKTPGGTLIRVAVTKRKGPRGGRTVATSLLRPNRKPR